MKFHRKIGGIHWIALGRYRVSFCKTRRRTGQLIPAALMPIQLVMRPGEGLYGLASRAAIATAVLTLASLAALAGLTRPF